MYPFKIGVMLDSFRLPVDEALIKAAEVGGQGLQVYATYGEMAPENLDSAKRKEFLRKVKAQGLVISALCGDLGKGFTDPGLNPELIEKSKRILDLAVELETNVVTTHIGRVPDDPADDTYKIMQAACRELAEYADSLKAHFAIETGPEPAARLRAFLDTLGSTGVGVNFDPANLVMVSGDNDLAAGVHRLAKYIVHTHAKDGMMLKKVDVSKLYEGDITDAIKQGGEAEKAESTGNPVLDSIIAAAKRGAPFIELPLGYGNVNWNGYLRALQDIGYKGFLTIERECGDDPAADITLAANFLRQKIAML